MHQPLLSLSAASGASRPLPGPSAIRRPVRRNAPRYALALLAAAVLSACQRPATDAAAPQAQAPAPAAAASAPAATPVAYTPPSADSLYQMVAPIALYPDRLVAQVLAASTYPDQVTDAAGWLGRNPGLHGDALVRAVNDQSWDPSVKALTAFPNVLQQLAANLPWTTALGQAYYHDPSDVMNAIQVMRARATKAGTLRSSPKLRVVTASAPMQQPAPAPVTVTPAVPLYAGPAVVPPPPAVIAIEPAEPATVYVPHYDPQVVYGTPVAVYPGYRWAAPAPAYVAAQPDPSSTWLAFGAGVVVGAVAGWAAHSPSWGWNAWNVHWGPPRPPAWVEGAPPPPPALAPAVVYQGATYVSHSRTVIENIRNVTVNNNQHYTTVNNNYQGAAPGTAVAPAALAAAPAGPAAPVAAFAAPRQPGAVPAMAQSARAAPAMVPPHALPLATALSPVQRPAQEHGMPAARMQPAARFLTPGGMPAQPHPVQQELGRHGLEPQAAHAQGPAAALPSSFRDQRPEPSSQPPSRHEAPQTAQQLRGMQPPVHAPSALPAMDAAPHGGWREPAPSAQSARTRDGERERMREEMQPQRRAEAPAFRPSQPSPQPQMPQAPQVREIREMHREAPAPERRPEQHEAAQRPMAAAPQRAMPAEHREPPHREGAPQADPHHHARERGERG